MLGALRDEVVPEVLGGRPAEPDGPPEQAVEHESPAVVVAEPELAPGAEDDPPAPAPAGHDVPPAPAVGDTGDVTSPSAPALSLDDVAASAVDLAREAAVSEAGSVVGEHLGVEPDDAGTVTHSFATTDPAYVGWRWAVTVARADGTDVVTVDEVVLLPGSDALLAPAWVPYSERVQPGDLGAGDLLPPEPDDVRLVPAYADPEAELAEQVFWELGLGRPRVLSREGRAEAAERWYEGDAGPRSPRAVSAPGTCGGCGFLVPLGGSLRASFGACANAQAPDDGRVVALTHGCGAHSETPVELTHAPVAEMVVDEVEYDYEDATAEPAPDEPAMAEPAPDEPATAEPAMAVPAPADPLPGPADEEQAGELGHS